MGPAQEHNQIAPEILKRIVMSCDSTSQAMVMTESVLMGVVMFAARNDSRKAAEYVEQMTQSILERLARWAVEA